MAPNNLNADLANFISSELLGGEPVSHDDELLTEGMVDSIGMMRLVVFIDESVGVSVPPEDFTIENFASINTICEYLTNRLDANNES